jgi:hypothetical protein
MAANPHYLMAAQGNHVLRPAIFAVPGRFLY